MSFPDTPRVSDTSSADDTPSIKKIAEAFSRHRFSEAFAHLAPDVRWVPVGQPTIEGKAAVIEACESTMTELTGVTTEFTRFVSVAGADAVAVDVIARYVEGNGDTSVVSSCDIYEFTGDSITTITSYAVELPAG